MTRKIVTRATWHQSKLYLRTLLWRKIGTHDAVDHLAERTIAAQHKDLRTSFLLYKLTRELNSMISILSNAIYKRLTTCLQQFP